MLNRDYGFDTKTQTRHEAEIACGCGTAQNQSCDPKKATELQIKGEGKKENKEFLGRV